MTFDDEDPTGHFQVAPGTYAQLTVSDTGAGMDRATREHIFEPFFTTKDVGKGTGLGLATIYAIVRQAGGHIWVYSEPGQGSTFKLYFPKHAADVTEALPVVGERPRRHEGRVMLVEDEETVRQMGTKLLERAGYKVVAMADGAAAQAYISEGRGDVDVLVTDVVMPGMSGIRLAEEMRARSPEVGLVLVSGYLAEGLDLRELGRPRRPVPLEAGAIPGFPCRRGRGDGAAPARRCGARAIASGARRPRAGCSGSAGRGCPGRSVP